VQKKPTEVGIVVWNVTLTMSCGRTEIPVLNAVRHKYFVPEAKNLLDKCNI